MQKKVKYTVMIPLILVGLLLLNGGFGVLWAQDSLRQAKDFISQSKYNEAVQILEVFIEANPPASTAPRAPDAWKPLAEAHYLLAKIYSLTIKLEDPKVETHLIKCFEMDIDFKISERNEFFKNKMAEVRKKVPYMEYKNEEGFLERRFIDGIVMVNIPKGKFKMGSKHGDSDERPPHDVFLDSYWIGKYEVTMGQYKTFISDAGHRSLPSAVHKLAPGDKHPVIGITWDDASAYCRWLSKKTGKHFTLPTEAQWEKAARGTDSRDFPWGKEKPSCDRANFKECNKGIMPVDTLSAGKSPYGLYNMTGNVYEWCRDCYHPNYYAESHPKNPEGPKDGKSRVFRGGGFNDKGDNLRTANRNAAPPKNAGVDLGFRICLERKVTTINGI